MRTKMSVRGIRFPLVQSLRARDKQTRALLAGDRPFTQSFKSCHGLMMHRTLDGIDYGRLHRT